MIYIFVFVDSVRHICVTLICTVWPLFTSVYADNGVLLWSSWNQMDVWVNCIDDYVKYVLTDFELNSTTYKIMCAECQRLCVGCAEAGACFVVLLQDVGGAVCRLHSACAYHQIDGRLSRACLTHTRPFEWSEHIVIQIVREFRTRQGRVRACVIH
jgi:hypothetical protein